MQITQVQTGMWKKVCFRKRQTLITLFRDFAANVGIAFKTPEEFFLEEEPRPFVRTFEPSTYTNDGVLALETNTVHTLSNDLPILVVFCGSPGSGKSSYYWSILQPLGYERVNQDILKTVSARWV